MFGLASYAHADVFVEDAPGEGSMPNGSVNPGIMTSELPEGTELNCRRLSDAIYERGHSRFIASCGVIGTRIFYNASIICLGRESSFARCARGKANGVPKNHVKLSVISDGRCLEGGCNVVKGTRR